MNNCCKDDEIMQMINKNKSCCKPCFGPTGATGPTGPAGPATIRIGVTDTGAPGTLASVTNVGTTENVVLDFTIPSGPTGPQGIAGPTGATGPQGIQGVAGPQGTQGLVGATGPTGPAGPQGIAGTPGQIGATGPTGPTGPRGESASVTNTYGRKYDTTENTIALEQNIAQDIPLGSNGPSNGITLNTQNKLTIPSDGIYKVDYYFYGSSSANTSLTISVKQNATPIGSTTISKDVTANNYTELSGSTINAFKANDQIGLSIESTDAATITPGSDTGAYINIIRLS